jgi:hypothetical protein
MRLRRCIEELIRRAESHDRADPMTVTIGAENIASGEHLAVSVGFGTLAFPALLVGGLSWVAYRARG